MESRPRIMEKFFTIHTSYIVNFIFTNSITILTGESGTGKVVPFSFIRECMEIAPNILCFNYLDYQKNIKEMISKEEGKFIVIDNADISLDDKNQYLITGRNSKNLFATSDNLFELVSEQKGEQTEFRLEPYL